MLRLSLEALEILDAIARRGSFAAAAEEVHRVPSAVTYMVRKLEDDIGVAIFDRSGHRATLTEAGLELLNEGRHLLRAANELECRIKRVATGWETELTIAVDTIIPLALMFPLLKQFDELGSGTRIRFLHESLGGTWEALLERRADIVVGAIAQGPAGGGYSTQVLGGFQSVFAIAPHHPLASQPEPLSPQTITQHRAVVIPDTARQMPTYSYNILSGQDVLRVPDMPQKVAAQVAGLGCGYLPLAWAQPYLDRGELIVKTVSEVNPQARLCNAWRSQGAGHAMKWWVEALSQSTAIQDWLQ
ncbi:LysR family transcriptional regulator [Chitinibacter bivalviorum]|uniref:LysR family transcriptional regulator n=1 Tax=Chitinibacter bivalviorum TaxID=2739434 RepID=A0A7H9BJR6_9NEIS|nr:LysR family transcriptional regulator [Chitinibacter bivalviorum]QLG88261.1 LysR family transcriptional regulator [Chitinibacter bivalviorum]